MKLMLAQNTAQPPVLNSRRSAGQLPAKMPLPPAAWRFTRPGGRNGRPTPALTAKGQGRARRRCVRKFMNSM